MLKSLWFPSAVVILEDVESKMKKSTQMIEWLRSSRFANETPMEHMFWVSPSDFCRRSDGREQTIGDFCQEIERTLSSEPRTEGENELQDWYFWRYYVDEEDVRYVFTRLPPLEDDRYGRKTSREARLDRIKKLLHLYRNAEDRRHSGRILATDGILSWVHSGTGLQWSTFSYLHSHGADHADLLNELCYAGHRDWRIPTIAEIRLMLSADKEIPSWSNHPMSGTLPRAMPLPIESTPRIVADDNTQRGYYVFDKETTETYGYRYNSRDEAIETGHDYGDTAKYLAVRGVRKVQRAFQTGWAGTLLAWTEKHMSLVEQGQLPGSAAGWKRVETLKLRSEHFVNGGYEAACAAMHYLEGLRALHYSLGSVSLDMPVPLYHLSRVKHLSIGDGIAFRPSVGSISRLSSEIARMTDLKDVDIRWQTELKELPDEVFNLPNLTTLDLGGCQKLVLTANQVRKICELVEAGVYISIPPLNLQDNDSRRLLLGLVDEKGGKLDLATDWEDVKRLSETKLKSSPPE